MVDAMTKAQELNQLGENLLKAGNAEAAYDYFKQAEEADPNEIASYLNQARTMIQAESLQTAKDALDKALLLDANHPQALFYMSSVCFLSDLSENGLLYANKALEAGCKETVLLVNMAIAYEDLGDVDRAVRYYNKAINAAPLEGSYYISKAECQMRHHKLDDALQTLDLLHKNCPDAFEAYHYSFLLYVQKQEYDKARAVLEDGIENFPGDAALYFDMVRLMNITRNSQEALQLLDALEEVGEAIQVTPRELKLERAKAMMLQEDLARAQTLLEETIALPGAGDFEAHYLLVNCYLAAEHYDKMEQVTKQMLQADDGSEFARAAHYYYPMSLLKQGREQEATEQYEQAIRYYRKRSLEEPQLIDVYMFRALCNKDLKRYEEALKVLDYLDQLLPDYAPAQMMRAAVYTDMGKKESAQQAYDNAGSLKEYVDEIMGLMTKQEEPQS